MYFKIFKNLGFYIKKESRKLLDFLITRNYREIECIPKISAYLSIYNDSDILDYTLNSIKDHVSELIIVDGAYEWNASYLSSIGLNPLQSEDSVYKKIKRSGIPFKTIKKIWKNEMEKRIAGYEATSSRYTMRIDADEVIFFDEKNLNNFFVSGCFVAEMYMPNYFAPGIVIQGKTLIDRYRTYPRQVCLFDKSKIDAKQHLQYLWLVLTADELPKNPSNKKCIYPVFEKPIAFCAHLTNWRTVESSMLRSSFYTMNWMRQNGAPWLANIKQPFIFNFDVFFNKIPPKLFSDVMKNSLINQGDIRLKSKEMLGKSPLSDCDEQKIHRVYLNFMSSLGKQVLALTDKGGVALLNYPIYIDISSNEVLEKISYHDEVSILFKESLHNVKVEILTLEKLGSSTNILIPTYSFDGTLLKIKKSYLEQGARIRRSLMVIPMCSTSNKAWVNFKILIK